jgi:hypothetical protein
MRLYLIILSLPLGLLLDMYISNKFNLNPLQFLLTSLLTGVILGFIL